MTTVAPGPDTAASVIPGAPRHGSTKRETLNVPADGRSTLVDRLSLLDLGKRDPTGAASPAAGPERFSDSGRSKWGVIEKEQQQEGPSLMDQMLAEAMAAKDEQSKQQRQEQLRDTKQNFGGGLKKGFLSRQTDPTSCSTARKGQNGGRRRREEGSSKAPGSTSSSKQESIPVITGRKASRGLEFDVSAEATSNASLFLPEVQEAMKSSPVGPLGSGGGGGQEWLTPELLEKIEEKPRLAAMLTDPRFCKAMQLMSTSPQDALGMFASSPEARESFTQLMSLLSTHFTALGETADKKAAAEEAERERVAAGPLAREALQRAERGVGVAATPATAQEVASVENILKQPELRQLLMDPDMQRVLQECGEPQVLARYVRHPEFGPKLQLMARAGLISFRS